MPKTRSLVVALLLTLSVRCLPSSSCLAAELSLWYDRPAADAINESLPVGNGRLGGLVAGGVDEECVWLNEISLWTGDGSGKRFGAYQSLGRLLVGFEPAAPALVTSP